MPRPKKNALPSKLVYYRTIRDAREIILSLGLLVDLENQPLLKKRIGQFMTRTKPQV
jgi:hypothetical protein